MLVADKYNWRIQAFGKDGVGSEFTIGDDYLDVTIDSDGMVYALSRSGVLKYTSDGTFVTLWLGIDSVLGKFGPSIGIAVDSSSVYVTSLDHNAVYVFDKQSGEVREVWKPQIDNRDVLNSPTGIVANDDYVFVAGGEEFRAQIVVFNKQGEVVTQLGTTGSSYTLWLPYGLDIFNDQLYIADLGGEIVIYDINEPEEPETES